MYFNKKVCHLKQILLVLGLLIPMHKCTEKTDQTQTGELVSLKRTKYGKLSPLRKE